MELDFDKEIDALLRGQARFIGERGRGTPGNGGASAGGHLDADELSVYAENAVPGPIRQAYTLHLADCDRCRKILSQFILLDEAADEPIAAAAAAPMALAEATVPWYRKLFLFPNLAYVMGGLVLVLGGFMALQVIQNTGDPVAGEVSQIAEQEGPGRGPNLGDETLYSANVPANIANTRSMANANTSAVSANRVAANSNLNTAGTRNVAVQPQTQSTPASDAEIAADGLNLARGNTVSPPPAAASAAEPDQAKAKQSELAAKKESPAKEEARDRAVQLRQLNDLPRAGATGTSRDEKKASGPSRNQQLQFPNTLSQSNEVAPRRKLSGKTFELKQGVWYDSTYRGSATTNMRRGSEEYRKLDRGLRSIADTLGGTVVVVWKSRAYRIQ